MPTTLTSNFDKTKTVAARWARVDFTPTGGSVVKISCKLIDPESKLQTTILKNPGLDHLNHAVEEVATEMDESVTLVDIEEIDTVISLLGGLNGLVKGACDVWVRDPRDATSKAKYKFPMTYRQHQAV